MVWELSDELCADEVASVEDVGRTLLEGGLLVVDRVDKAVDNGADVLRLC